MAWEIIGTEHLRPRNPEQDVIDRIDELVDWQMTDSDAAKREEVRCEVAAMQQMSWWRFAREIAKYFVWLVRAYLHGFVMH